jgi:predicted nucleic acid-binding Zn ribbon protein
MSQRTAWQLTGYLLLDAADRYRIDTVGRYLSRSGVLASWPVDDYLALLGAYRRNLTELRGVFGELLSGCRGQADARYFGTEEETERIRQLLERLAPVAGPGDCPVCTQPLPESARRPRKFCTTRCRDRDKVLRRRGLMPGGPRPLLPSPRKELLDLPHHAEIVSLTTIFPGRRVVL